jgi:peptide/nickel transport system ATP-binding protein
MARENIGIVGESGSGKSLTGKALLGLVPNNGTVSARKLKFDGRDLLTASSRDLRMLRGKHVGLVMQDPKYCLNPVRTVGRQIGEACWLSTGADAATARRRSLDMLRAVQINDPERVFDAYPHELSGGMAQRVMMAMMVIAEPDLLIADEPTSALDVTVQLEVLSLLDKLIRDRGMGLIFISHDLRLVSQFCDRVVVMYAGRVVETLRAAELHNAQHAYTRGLLNCLPTLEREPGTRLPTLQRDAAWTA